MAHAIVSISSAVLGFFCKGKPRYYVFFFGAFFEWERAVFRTLMIWALDKYRICVFHAPEKGLRVNFRKTSVLNHCQENGRVLFLPLPPPQPYPLSVLNRITNDVCTPCKPNLCEKKKKEKWEAQYNKS